jgi:hypothetical protein
MKPRTYATFEWSAEEKNIFSASGDVAIPGGRNILSVVRASLVQRGYNVSEVAQNESYGWSFQTEANGVRVWSMLQFSEPWLLITSVPLRWLQRIKGRPVSASLASVVNGLHECLRASSLASKLQWFSREEFERLEGNDGASVP